VERLDGFFALITCEKSELSAEQMVHAYRQKYLIESAFREMKTVLKLRPWFVYKEAHVRAHYTVCVLAYLLEKQIDLLLEKNGFKEKGWTLGRLKEHLSQYHLVELGIGDKSQTVLQKIPAELKELLKTLKLGLALSLPAQN
jgi:transposase